MCTAVVTRLDKPQPARYTPSLDVLLQNPKNRLDLHEGKDGSVYVKGLNTFVVKSVEEIASVLEASSASNKAVHCWHTLLVFAEHCSTNMPAIVQAWRFW